VRSEMGKEVYVDKFLNMIIELGEFIDITQ
jgi:hypothetical protein